MVIYILQNLNVNVISLISSDRTNNILPNGVLHFKIRWQAVEISQLSENGSKPPCSILKRYNIKISVESVYVSWP